MKMFQHLPILQMIKLSSIIIQSFTKAYNRVSDLTQIPLNMKAFNKDFKVRFTNFMKDCKTSNIKNTHLGIIYNDQMISETRVRVFKPTPEQTTF